MSGSTFEIGTSFVRVLVPSRQKTGGIVQKNTRDDWEDRARKALSTAPFGGCTPENVIGSFVHDDGRVTKEEITVLTSSCPAATLADEGAKQRVIAFAKELCAALGQESIFVGWGDLAILVEANFDLASIPVIPFRALGEEAKSKHLAMGWGGIDDPKKVLQVLSLDTWTLPSREEAEATSGLEPLSLRAVLHEPEGLRRAWSWSADAATFKAAQKGWSGPAAPREGDLVFMHGKPGYLDLLYRDGRSFVGPRDLRRSHGQLNPVTRHLLQRILMREWKELAEDLTQKPLDKGFFPKLQKLRAAVEVAVIEGDAARAAEQRVRAKATSKAAKAKKSQNAVGTAPPRSAFRTSVLVVGRMMFLRFLAQKGWLPGGVEALVEAYQRHGEGFFEKHVLPLWFDVLNVPVARRAASTRKTFEDQFPYLNGGLFQPRAGEWELRLPARLFDPAVPGSFLQLFKDFEFSLNEHAGSDDSLKIDPSIFGKALETFNPEKDRKSEGVHYTPKPIAWALALEAILARVERLSGIDRERLEGLLAGERRILGSEARRVSKVLSEMRIVDPAVGSGVLLWASLEVLMALDSACSGIVNGAAGYQRGSMTWGQRSRHFVCNCLYGVDLSEEAVELTRLRLWLAVALSESEAQPLPDLELNIARGDSLLLQEKEPLAAKGGGKAKQLKLALDERDALENALERLTRDYLEAGEADPAKQRALRARVIKARRELAVAGSGENQELPLDWRLFFPHVFRDGKKGGFDVVIANPPYIRIQTLKKSEAGQAYLDNWSTLASGNADLSYAFVELALRELAAPDGGQVAFIQPNFRHHDAAAAVRDMLVGKNDKVPARLRLWVDFGDAKVFPTATNYVALLFAERTKGGRAQSEFSYSNPAPGSWVDSEDLAWMRHPKLVTTHPAECEWLTVEPALRQRVMEAQRRSTRRLGDLAEIHVGVQTSADDIFLFEHARELDGGLLEVVPRGGGEPVKLEQAAVRPCVKGSSRAEFHLLFPYSRDGKLLTEAAVKKQFPMAWAYLKAKKGALEGRENGAFGGKDWYRFGRQQGQAVASVPKVVVPALLRAPAAIVDSEGALAFTASGKGGGGAWALVPKDGVTLEALAAAMNALVAWDHILVHGSPQQGGWRGVDKEVLAGIPV